MRLTASSIVLSVAILALAGCRGVDLAFDADQSSPRDINVTQSAQREVPFQVVVDNTFEVVPPPPPPFVHAIFRGTGRGEPFGPVGYFATSEINLFVVPTEQTTEGVFTYPDGSELHFSTVGFALDQLEDNIYGEFTITGGTGRFTNATGGGTYVGTVFLDTSSAHWALEGVVSGFGGRVSGGKQDPSD